MYSNQITAAFSILIALGGWVISLHATQRRWLHFLQLEDYEPARMLRHAVRRPRRLQLLAPELIGMAALPLSATAAATMWGLGCIWRAIRVGRILRRAKKPLVNTARSQRIQTAGHIISAILLQIAFAVFFPQALSKIDIYNPDALVGFILSPSVLTVLLASMFAIERFIPLTLAAAVAVLWPIERMIQRRYITEARLCLSEMNPLVIGITGSYGKTGTKELLSAMLAEKFNVFRPPASYNTLMGVTRVVREQLRPFHEVLVVEMGAYRLGSIARLCDLSRPRHGIITGIGVQHLERFKDQQTIKQAKGELVRALPDVGVAVLNADDPLCREIADEHDVEVVFFSVEDRQNSGNVENESSIPVVCARNVSVGIGGSTFALQFPDRAIIQVSLPLLGRGAVANAAAAAAMAFRLGVSPESIRRALTGVRQIRHRLELTRREDGVYIIDDAYNSNPVGAAHALEVLASTNTGRRVLVTPGMVELGRLGARANYDFGMQAARSCDLAVLIGNGRTGDIRRGLESAGMDESKIWPVASLQDGFDRLKGYLQPGDVMLLENDLPDQYY